MRPLFGLPLGANLSLSRLAPSAADTGPGINMAVTAPSTHPEAGPVKFKPPSTTRMVVGAIGDAVAQWSGGKAIFTPALAAARERHEQTQAELMRRAGEFAMFKSKYDYERENPKPSQAQPYRFESNDGDVYEIGPEGQPRRLFDDPAPRLQWIPDGMGGGSWAAPPGMSGAPATTAPPPTSPIGKLTPITGGASPAGSRGFPVR